MPTDFNDFFWFCRHVKTELGCLLGGTLPPDLTDDDFDICIDWYHRTNRPVDAARVIHLDRVTALYSI